MRKRSREGKYPVGRRTARFETVVFSEIWPGKERPSGRHPLILFIIGQKHPLKPLLMPCGALEASSIGCRWARNLQRKPS